MTESRMLQTEGPLTAAPGLQLIGSDADAGLCVDGVCVLPGQTFAPAEKSD